MTSIHCYESDWNRFVGHFKSFASLLQHNSHEPIVLLNICMDTEMRDSHLCILNYRMVTVRVGWQYLALYIVVSMYNSLKQYATLD